VGRAVHGVLQTVDLATGAGLDEALAAQCEAEAVPDRIDDVRRLVLAALGSPSVQEAAACPHWREVYACTPLDGRLLEGYIDLLYRGPDGLVVVDHKTAATSDPDELDRRVEGYRIQGASYALTVAATTAEPVVSGSTFLLDSRCPDGAVEAAPGRPRDLVWRRWPRSSVAHHQLVRHWQVSTYPTIDVLLPTCGEDLRVLRQAWTHIRAMSYAGEVNVYVLDDSAVSSA
jgi:hypothetical protein